MKTIVLSVLVSIISCVSLYAENRALIIGIGEYQKGTSWTAIHGDEDVKMLAPMFLEKGFHVSTLTNAQASKKGIVAALNLLVEQSNVGDVVYLHFSGHGQPIDDINGDENGKFDQSIIPYDAGKVYLKAKYEGENHLGDDEFSHYLKRLKDKLGKRGLLFVTIDACYSRGSERGKSDDDIKIIKYCRGTNDIFEYRQKYPLKELFSPANLSGGASMYVLTACNADERNYEHKMSSGKMCGSLSYCVYVLLRNGFEVSKWTDFINKQSYLRHNIFQKPQHPSIKIYQ